MFRSFFAIFLLSSPVWAQVNPTPSPTATSLTVSTLTTGTLLDVRGAWVSGDGRYVNMDLGVTSSSLTGMDLINSAGQSLTTSRAVGIRPLSFRPAEVGLVTLVEMDKKLLTKETPETALEGVPFRQAVRKLATMTKTNIVLGTAALKQAKLDEGSPITMKLGKGTLKEDLLALLGAFAPHTPMVITAEEGVVFVTTRAQADTQVVRKTYYLQDLLGNAPRYIPPEMDLATVGRSALTPPVTLEAMTRPAPRPASSSLGSVGELITSTVRPEIWKVNGGKYGEITQAGDRVFITAPMCVHVLLEGPGHYKPGQVPRYVNYAR